MTSIIDILNTDPNQIGDAATVNPVVEPLGGVVTVDDVMDARFPDSVFQTGTDTHIYKFMATICGDAGAGFLVKQSLNARMSLEGEDIDFGDLDAFYGNHFSFRRLRNEVYSLDPTTDYLTSADLADVNAKDASYKKRLQYFMAATRQGNAPDGMLLAAMAGSGVDADVIENYRYVYDRYSDDPVGILPVGQTGSVNEFVVNFRPTESDPTETAPMGPDPLFPGSVPYTSTSTKAALVASASQITPTPQIANVPYTTLAPDVERNVVDVMDRLRPVGALMSFATDDVRFNDVSVNSVFATSSRMNVARFVTGNPQVSWPPVNSVTGEFIVARQEREAPLSDWSRVRTAVYQTVESIYGYTDQALYDPLYGDPSFFAGASNGTAPYTRYQSLSAGSFNQAMTALFASILTNVSPATIYTVDQALATQNTALQLLARNT